MTGARRRLLVVTAILAASTALVRTQSQRPLGIVDFLNVPRLGDPQLSPDGREVLFTRSDSDWKGGRRISHIWRVAVSGGQPVQLTNGGESENAPRWSPDGRTIAFTAKRGDNEFAQIYLLPVEGGEARQLTTHGSAVCTTNSCGSDIAWTPDGSAIYFTAQDPKTAEEKTRDRNKDDVYLYDENFKQSHLWKVSVASKAETQITKGDFSVRGFELSDDGKKDVYHRWPK